MVALQSAENTLIIMQHCSSRPLDSPDLDDVEYAWHLAKNERAR